MNKHKFTSDVVAVTFHDTLPLGPYLPNKVLLVGGPDEYSMYVTTWDGKHARHLTSALTASDIATMIDKVISDLNIVTNNSYAAIVDARLADKKLYTQAMLSDRITATLNTLATTLTDAELYTLMNASLDDYMGMTALNTALTAALTAAGMDKKSDRDADITAKVGTLSSITAENSTTTSQIPVRHVRAPMKIGLGDARIQAIKWGFNADRNLFKEGSKQSSLNITNMSFFNGFTPALGSTWVHNNSTFGGSGAMLTPSMRALGDYRITVTPGDEYSARYGIPFRAIRVSNPAATFAGTVSVVGTGYIPLAQARYTFFIYVFAGTVEVNVGNGVYEQVPVDTGRQVINVFDYTGAGYISGYLVKASKDADFEIMVPKIYQSIDHHPQMHSMTYQTYNAFNTY